MTFGGRQREEFHVDVTPLIDIIFQLVLFFMVSTTFVTTPGIQVDLPRASAQTIIRERNDLNVWIKDDRTIYIDRDAMNWQGLSDRFVQTAKEDPSTLVIVKADREVEHGRVVAVMDLARRLGLTRLAIATEVNKVDKADPSPP